MQHLLGSPPTQPAVPLWRRLPDVAQELGLLRDHLLSAAQSGQLPIRVQKIGKLWFLSGPDVRAYRAWVEADSRLRAAVGVR